MTFAEEQLEKIIRLEERYENFMVTIDQHVRSDERFMTEIRESLDLVFEKIHNIAMEQARQRTIMWTVGATVVFLSPVINAFLVSLWN